MIDDLLRHFSVERVDRLHALGLQSHGGSGGTLHKGCVERCLQAAAMAAHYREPNGPGDLFVFAANLLYLLANNHCYGDGNKRVAWKVFAEVFQINGLRVVATDEEAEQLVLNVADSSVGWKTEHIIVWLQEEGRIIAADYVAAPEIEDTEGDADKES